MHGRPGWHSVVRLLRPAASTDSRMQPGLLVRSLAVGRLVVTGTRNVSLGLRLAVVVICVVCQSACTKQAAPASPSGTAPEADPGPPPPIPTTDGATFTLTGTGVSPKQVRVYQDSRVTFLNSDVANHEIDSNPLHVHTDCPELNVGFVVPGESRSSGQLPILRACGFHDHLHEGDSRYYGTVFVDPR
jgi:hypothetical protein